MNEFQRTLYRDLLALCHPGQEAFYYIDQPYAGQVYRIFLYRLASYTEFMQPGALECRGHTFLLGADGEATALVSLPMQKFFNLGENPMAMGLDLTTVEHIMDKLDGSLISSGFCPINGMLLKSKGSLLSSQAEAARQLLRFSGELGAAVKWWTQAGYTVNMEYTAPLNRIVIGYQSPELRVLNVRDLFSGQYLSHDEILHLLPPRFVVGSVPVPADCAAWVAAAASLKGIEGFVVRLASGVMFKLKTEEYCALHKTKDSIAVPRKLFEACVLGVADDLRSILAGDALAISQINEMEERVAGIYNHLDAYVRAFYEANKHLGRKEYALAGQADGELMEAGAFSLAMDLYLGKDPDVQQFMIKRYKQYGITDEVVTLTAQ